MDAINSLPEFSEEQAIAMLKLAACSETSPTAQLEIVEWFRSFLIHHT